MAQSGEQYQTINQAGANIVALLDDTSLKYYVFLGNNQWRTRFYQLEPLPRWIRVYHDTEEAGMAIQLQEAQSDFIINPVLMNAYNSSHINPVIFYDDLSKAVMVVYQDISDGIEDYYNSYQDYLADTSHALSKDNITRIIEWFYYNNIRTDINISDVEIMMILYQIAIISDQNLKGQIINNILDYIQTAALSIRHINTPAQLATQFDKFVISVKEEYNISIRYLQLLKNVYSSLNEQMPYLGINFGDKRTIKPEVKYFLSTLSIDRYTLHADILDGENLPSRLLEVFDKIKLSQDVPVAVLITSKVKLIKVYQGVYPDNSPVIENIIPKEYHDNVNEDDNVNQLIITVRNQDIIQGRPIPQVTSKQTYVHAKMTITATSAEMKLSLPLKSNRNRQAVFDALSKRITTALADTNLDITDFRDNEGGVGGEFMLIHARYNIDSLALMTAIDATLRTFFYIDEAGNPLSDKRRSNQEEERMSIYLKSFLPGDENKPVSTGYVSNLPLAHIILTQMVVSETSKEFNIMDFSDLVKPKYTTKGFPAGTEYIKIRISGAYSDHVIKRIVLLISTTISYYINNMTVPHLFTYLFDDRPLNNRDGLRQFINYTTGIQQQSESITPVKRRSRVSKVDGPETFISRLAVSVQCQKNVRPTFLGRTEEEARAALDAAGYPDRNILEFPLRSQLPEQTGYYGSLIPEFPFVYPKELKAPVLNEHTDGVTINYVPCCGKRFNQNKLDRYLRGETGNVRGGTNYTRTAYTATPEGGHSVVRSDVVVFIAGKETVTNDNTYDDLGILNGGLTGNDQIDVNQKLRRRGVFQGPNSLIHCILSIIFPDNTPIETLRQETINIRQRLANSNLSLIRQQTVGYSDNELLSILNNFNSYFDPLLFYRLLEDLFGINIFFFYSEENVHGNKTIENIMAIPPNKGYFIRSPVVKQDDINFTRMSNTILIALTPSDNHSYPYHCELIVMTNNNGIDINRSFDRLLTYKLLSIMGFLIPLNTFDVSYQPAPLSNSTTQKDNRLVPLIDQNINLLNTYDSLLFLRSIDPMLKVIGQYIDSYGKQRGLAINFFGVNITVGIIPSEPQNLPVMKEIYRVKLSDLIEWIGIEPIGYSLAMVLEEGVAVIDGAWYPITDGRQIIFRQGYYFFLEPEIKKESFLIMAPAILINDSDEVSPIYRYHYFVRQRNIILRLVEWLVGVLKYQRLEHQNDFDPYFLGRSLADHFIEDYLTKPEPGYVVPDSFGVYQLDKLEFMLPEFIRIDDCLNYLEQRLSSPIGEERPKQHTNLIMNGKIWCYSLKFYEGICYYIRTLNSYYSSLTVVRSIPQLYYDKYDYNNDNSIVFTDRRDYNQWIEFQTEQSKDDKTTTAKIIPHIYPSSKILDIYFKTPNPSIIIGSLPDQDHRRFLLQPTNENSLIQALKVADYWARNKVNLGYNVTNYFPESPPYVIYTSDDTWFELISDNTGGVVPYLEILKYQKGNKLFYVPLLPIGNEEEPF